jgi:hypothetical protein
MAQYSCSIGPGAHLVGTKPFKRLNRFVIFLNAENSDFSEALIDGECYSDTHRCLRISACYDTMRAPRASLTGKLHTYVVCSV